MNYQKVYDQIVQRATKERIERLRLRKTGVYFEGHHIIPKCLGGNNTKDNIAQLTAREHYICHWLLVRINPANEKLIYAWWRMSPKGNTNRYTPSSRTYEECKELFSNVISLKHKGKKKQPFTVEHKANLSISHLGKKLGKRPQEVVDRIKKANTGKTRSLETRTKQRLKKLGVVRKPITEIARQNMINAQRARFVK